MATRVNDGALVSRVSRLGRSRARVLLSLNLKKKRDCSQSTVAGVGTFFYQSISLEQKDSSMMSVKSLTTAYMPPQV